MIVRLAEHLGKFDERSEVGMQYGGASARCPFAVDVSHNHDRKFETLRLVNGHQPDDVARLRQRRRELFVGLFQHRRVQPFDEVGQREQLAPIELTRHLNQLPQVGDLTRPEMFREQRRVVAGAVDRACQQFGQRQTVLHRTQLREDLTCESQASLLLIIEKRGGLGEQAVVQCQSVAAEGLNRVVAHVEERRSQDADQPDQVIRIVEVTAEVEQIEHLLLREERFAADEVVVEAVVA